MTVGFGADAGWEYFPAFDDGEVVGFIVERTEAPVSPSEYSVLWYERVNGQFTLALGWTDAGAVDAAQFVCAEQNDPTLFEHSMIGVEVAEANGGCGVVLTPGDPVELGLSTSDPMQSLAGLLTPELMEIVIEMGAAGASTLSALEVEGVAGEGGAITLSAAVHEALAADFEASLAAGEPIVVSAIGLCIPGNVCYSVTVRGGCQSAGGFGNGSCAGCKYTCDFSTIRTCAYRSWDCTLGQPTTTTTTSPGSIICPGDPSDCPQAPPAGC
ncbi:MAG: hypothetical protein RBS39_00230 [Phycisphaerales bacterium]|nr:hypothetical protein [Phycisphaerales bacterium]